MDQQQQRRPSPSAGSATPFVAGTPQSVSQQSMLSSLSRQSSSRLGQGQGKGPFWGLVVCVTGLTKEARKQVQQATEAMGGSYSPDLHPHCTHLVVQIYAGRKFEHAVKHGLRRGLFVVTLAWFVNCARQNSRLDEEPYRVERSQMDAGVRPEDFSKAILAVPSDRFCLPPGFRRAAISRTQQAQPPQQQQQQEVQQQVFSGACFYLDADLHGEVREKVVEAAAAGSAGMVENWFIGCSATHVVCEGTALLRYVGFNTHIVSPTWVLRTAKEREQERCVHFSVDLSRQLACFLEHARGSQGGRPGGRLAICGPPDDRKGQSALRERQDEVAVAKADVRRRRSARLQAFRTNVQPFTPAALLDTVCWCVTEPPGTACVALCFDAHDRVRGKEGSGGLDGEVVTRAMTESERWEVVYSPTFLTLLFPVDQFSEIGPTSKTFVSDRGFTRQHILECISKFYQDFLSPDEVRVALHTDSKVADRLRSCYASKQSVETGYVSMRRTEFLGNRRFFEGLRRLSKEPTSQLYEVLIFGA